MRFSFPTFSALAFVVLGLAACQPKSGTDGELGADGNFENGLFLRYAMSMEGSPEAEDPMMGMMQGAEMDMYFTEKAMKTTMQMGGGLMKSQAIARTDQDSMDNYMSFMGGNYHFRTALNFDMISWLSLDSLELVAVPEQNREILGYACEAYQSMGLDSVQQTLWLTQDIAPAFKSKVGSVAGAKGFPLGVKMVAMGQTISFEAIQIGKEVKPEDFAAPEGEYQEMDPSEMMGMF